MRIAILADSHLQRGILRELLGRLGHEVVFNAAPGLLEAGALGQYAADAWLVCLLHVDRHQHKLLEQLYDQDIPVLVDEGEAPPASSEDYPRWQRSLENKLDALCPPRPAGVLPVQPGLPGTPDGEPAAQLWLLAASLGGPAAVKEFLDCLPAGLPIGFLYAQHIDPGFEKSLPRAVGRHSQWQVRLARHNDFVRSGEVVVVPVGHELSFTASGRMQCLERPWTGSYAPSIGQMMLNLATGFGRRSGVIVFSGMGGDGSGACMDAAGLGMQIWTQDAGSSACPSMPDSVRETGYSTCSGSPRELAQALLQHVGRAS